MQPENECLRCAVHFRGLCASLRGQVGVLVVMAPTNALSSRVLGREWCVLRSDREINSRLSFRDSLSQSMYRVRLLVCFGQFCFFEMMSACGSFVSDKVHVCVLIQSTWYFEGTL